MASVDTIIVGGGLAGLCCALELERAGRDYLLIEKDTRVGGRVKTDERDGFLLDHGFQVLLTAYPEAQRVLDYEGLKLCEFTPGALIRTEGGFHRLTDPWRKPFAGVKSAFSPVGSIKDKLRVGKLRGQALKGTLEGGFARPDTSTLKLLEQQGFSPDMIEKFFRPYLSGIFLEKELATSSRMFWFVFRMFAEGAGALPEGGMGKIPEQLAQKIPPERLRLGCEVASAKVGAVCLASGESIACEHLVLATDAWNAARLLPEIDAPKACGVTCFYYAAPQSPVGEPTLVLNGTGKGPINNLCVPSDVSPCYAPDGASLVSVSTLEEGDDESLAGRIESQLTDWYGAGVNRWSRLGVYRIPHALPSQTPPALAEPERPVRQAPGLYVCGDHMDNASIQGAMVSGRRTAEAILNA